MTRCRWALATGIYVVISVAILARFWTLSASPIWDAFDYFYPAFAFLSDTVREGRLPLWDPYTNCGLPYHADPQAATLNPLALLLSALPRRSLGFVLFWNLHWVAAGLGMFVVVRALRGTPAGGLVAALAYAFSGFFVGHAQHTSWLVTAAWLPFAVGLAHLAVATGRVGFALLAGAAMGMSSLGGYPVLVGVGLYFVALWLAAAFLGPWARFEGERPSRGRLARRIVATLAVVTAILVAVWSPVLHAFLVEAREYTHRSAPIAGDLVSFLHPFGLRASISLFFPYAIVLAQPWITADISMNNAYAGLLSLPLAAVAFTSRRPGNRPIWLLAVTALMVAVSMSERGFLGRVLLELVPPMRFMRHHAGYRVFWILPLAAAAGLGASLAIASPRARVRVRRAFVGTAAIALVAAGGLAIVLRSLRVDLSPTALVRLYAPAVVVLPATATLLWRWRSRPARALLPVGLVGLLVIDLAAHVHLSSATVAMPRKRMRQAEKLPRETNAAAPRQVGSSGPSFNVQQLTRSPVARGYVTMKRSGFDDGLALGRHLEVLVAHRYWLAPAAALATDEATMLATLAGRGATDPVPVFVDRPEAALAGDPVVPGAFGAFRIASYRPERVKLEVDLPGPAVFASTERFAPGWKVTVDGVSAPALRVNVFFRGVLLPPGRHVVVWKYRPARWWALVALSAVTLAGSIAGGIVLLRRRPAGSPCGHPGRGRPASGSAE